MSLLDKVGCNAPGCKEEFPRTERAKQYKYHVCGEECLGRFVTSMLREQGVKLEPNQQLLFTAATLNRGTGQTYGINVNIMKPAEEERTAGG